MFYWWGGPASAWRRWVGAPPAPNANGPAEGMARARSCLAASQIDAEIIEDRGPAADAILRAAQEHHCDLIVMGGYSRKPVAEVVFGSTVDAVLRQFPHPVFIVR